MRLPCDVHHKPAEVAALTQLGERDVEGAGSGVVIAHAARPTGRRSRCAELVQLFDRNPERSPFTSPQRILSLAYVHGLAPRPEHPDFSAVRFNIIPGSASSSSSPPTR